MKRKLISFADSRMAGALKRLRRQAEQMRFFDEIETVTEKELGQDFREAHARYLRPGVRGYGYWIWKPYIILRALNELQDGDELYYVDAGCHFKPAGRKRLLEYADILESDALGLAAFQLGEDCSERKFTKMDVLIHMGVQENDSVLNSGQFCGTHVFLVKNQGTVRFAETWLKEVLVMHHVDDSPSLSAPDPLFLEHRHDQSIFSILCKLNNVAALPGSETWPQRQGDWKSLSRYPIWDKRDLGVTLHLISRAWRKLGKLWKKGRG